MKKFSLILLFFSFITIAKANSKVENFIFLGGDSEQLKSLQRKLNNKEISGVQIVYTWKSLEPEKGKYNFTQIESDLKFLESIHKKLFIQIQDRFFEPTAKNIPFYLLQDPQYNGGLTPQLDNPGENKPLVSGWITQQWNISVRQRYQKLLLALANKFDGRIYGINLPETAIDIDIKHDNTNFTCDKYFNAELDNIKFARSVFKYSYVVQYVNFFPCEWNNNHNYMSRLFEYAKKNNIGLGGPDVVPYKKSHMNNSYPFFHRYKGSLSLVAMAVQEPDSTYTNPKTKKHFTHQEFANFAKNYLGANIIFWSINNL